MPTHWNLPSTILNSRFGWDFTKLSCDIETLLSANLACLANRHANQYVCTPHTQRPELNVIIDDVESVDSGVTSVLGSSKAARDPPWNSRIKALSLVIAGAPVQSVQSSCGMFHIVHASLMSQESQKFPLCSIPLCFVNLTNMNLHGSHSTIP